MEEVWRDIEEFKGIYQVSNLGRVKNLSRIVDKGRRARRIPEHLIALGIKPNGYVHVKMMVGGRLFTRYVHRLVADAFIPNPDGKAEVNHKDGIKTHNSIDNLEWVTRSENHLHAWHVLHRKPTAKIGEENKLAIPILQFTLDGKFIREWCSATDAQRHTGMSEMNIRHCLYGEQETAYGYKWKYKYPTSGGHRGKPKRLIQI